MKKIIYTLITLLFAMFSFAQENGSPNSNLIDMSYLKTANKKMMPTALGNATYRTYANEFAGVDNLEDLSLLPSDTRVLTIQNKELKELNNSILSLKELELLDVSHNNLEDLNAQIFEQLTNLKRVYVNNNLITDEQVEAWRKSFPKILFYTDKEIYSQEYLNSTEYQLQKSSKK